MLQLWEMKLVETKGTNRKWFSGNGSTNPMAQPHPIESAVISRRLLSDTIFQNHVLRDLIDNAESTWIFQWFTVDMICTGSIWFYTVYDSIRVGFKLLFVGNDKELTVCSEVK